MQWDIDTVRDLMNSSRKRWPRGGAEGYIILTHMLTKGLIQVEVRPFEPLPLPDDDHPLRPKQVKGGAVHTLLKWQAANWLRSIGEPSPIYEHSIHGRYADVWAPNARFWVECGDTDPRKFVEAFRRNFTRAICVFPFERQDEAPNRVYIFRPTRLGRRFLKKRYAQSVAMLTERIRART